MDYLVDHNLFMSSLMMVPMLKAPAVVSGGFSGATGQSFMQKIIFRACGINSNRQAAPFYESSPAMAELESYRALSEDDWDGYGAAAISEQTLDNSMIWLRFLMGSISAPDLCPNPHGTISLQWSTSEGMAYLEIGESRYSFFLTLKSEQSVTLDGLASSFDQRIPFLIAQALYPKPMAIPTLSGYAAPNVRMFAAA